MDSGWKMTEIDDMDMLGFLRVRAHKAQKEDGDGKPKETVIKEAYIDEVWNF